MQRKSLALGALVVLVWLALSAISFPSFEATIPSQCAPVQRLLLLSFYGWFSVFWLWGINNLFYQVAAFPRRFTRPPRGDARPDAQVAIIYTTCDDFDPQACASALTQTHPHTRLVICDDSFDPANRQTIDRWAKAQGERVTVVRRPDNKGFKAGNLNHAIRGFIPEEYLLVCDADEIIPPDFVEALLPYFVDDEVGFVQANHCAHLNPQTQFAAFQAFTVDMYWKYFLPAKNRFGFVLFQGHGALIRRSVWEQTGGFPEVICEDMAFSSRARAIGYRGVFVPDIIAQEACPLTYRALVKSRSRIIKGTVEYFQQEWSILARSRKVTLAEKLDVLITASSSSYMPLAMTINLWGGIILAYLHRAQGYQDASAYLPFLYVLGPLGSVAPVLFELVKQPVRYGQYLFAAAANHASLMPMLSVAAVEQTLLLRAPTFHVTGKIARQRETLTDYSLSIPFGLSVLAGAIWLPSAISSLMIGVSLTFLLTPLIVFTEKKGLLGMVGRQWGLAPYVAILLLGVCAR